MNLIVKRSPTDELLALAAERTDADGYRRDAQALALYDGDDLLMIVVLDNFGPKGPDLHFADMDPRWANRRCLALITRVLFDTPPHGLAFDYVRAMIPFGRVHMQIVALKTGFQFIARLPSGAEADEDVMVMGMDALSCRWLPPVSVDRIARRRDEERIRRELAVGVEDGRESTET